MNEVQTLQVAFFNKIRQKISSKTVFANQIAAVLSISVSEAYNKIQGKSLLTIPQIQVLCETYNESFLISATKTAASALFEFLPVYQKQITIEKYAGLAQIFLSVLDWH